MVSGGDSGWRMRATRLLTSLRMTCVQTSSAKDDTKIDTAVTVSITKERMCFMLVPAVTFA